VIGASGAERLLALDQGTTSSRAILFDAVGAPLHSAQIELPQFFPRPGWVEHDPERIWADTVATARQVLAKADGPVAALGITNQRETTVVWDRGTGKPIHPAIVWQDRRTAALCGELRAEGLAATVQARTGLVIDPYFSATKLAWLLDNVDGARAAAERGALAFGTVDCFLLWRLTGGRVHATDASNAARTMLFDIAKQQWDDDLLRRLRIPASLLPDVRDCASDFGVTESGLFDRAIAIRGMAGDQQAATFGQCAFNAGDAKCTYGTGAFMLLNTGRRMAVSANRVLATVAWRLDGRVTYAMEGAIFVAGAAIQWLRDGLGLIRDAQESAALAASVPDTGGVYLVPAFTGLGAPWWDADARGALLGLTRASARAEIVRAALEALAYQTADLVAAMRADDAPDLAALRVDGGLVGNDWAMQFLADMLGLPVERPAVTESTARGAALLAGMAAGVCGTMDDIARQWRLDQHFTPAMAPERRSALYDGWRDAVARVLTR
jgi:glycerol kinase